MIPVCIRFVDKNLNIREELLEVVSLPRITGLHIANKLKEVVSVTAKVKVTMGPAI